MLAICTVDCMSKYEDDVSDEFSCIELSSRAVADELCIEGGSLLRLIC